MKRFVLLATIVALMPACDAYDGIRTWVEFDRVTEQFHVHARIENVSKSFFNCADAPDCHEVIRDFITGTASAPIPKRILGLADSGAMDLKVGLEKDGDELDVLIWYATYPGTVAAEATGVSLEREGKSFGKLRTHLVVDYDSKRHLEGAPYERRVVYESTGQGAEVQAQQQWLLHHKVSSVVVYEAVDKAVGTTPILSEVAGLEDALTKGGLL